MLTKPSTTPPVRLRKGDWETPWVEFIAEAREAPLEYGQFDCMLMMGRNIEVITGDDVYTTHVGKYSTELGSFRYLKKLGYPSLVDQMDALCPRIPVAQARRGDIVYWEKDNCIGICLGSASLFKHVQQPCQKAEQHTEDFAGDIHAGIGLMEGISQKVQLSEDAFEDAAWENSMVKPTLGCKYAWAVGE